MAEKRMFSNKITQLDEFLDLPATTQNLYFHLNMDADDEGFVSSPKKVMRMIGASQRDLEGLIQYNFIIGFETGVVVVRHWKIHNTIRKDRIRITMYEDERARLSESGGVYELLTASCQPNDNQVTTECPHSIDKISLEESSIEEFSIEKNSEENIEKEEVKIPEIVYFTNPEVESLFKDFLEFRLKLKAKNTDRAITLLVNELNKYNDEIKIEMMNNSIMNSWKSVFAPKGSRKSNDQSTDWEGI